jgi:hypothetical protein
LVRVCRLLRVIWRVIWLLSGRQVNGLSLNLLLPSLYLRLGDCCCCGGLCCQPLPPLLNTAVNADAQTDEKYEQGNGNNHCEEGAHSHLPIAISIAVIWTLVRTVHRRRVGAAVVAVVVVAGRGGGGAVTCVVTAKKAAALPGVVVAVNAHFNIIVDGPGWVIYCGRKL